MAEFNNDVGFTVDLVGPADLELSFAWEVDIRLTATQLEGSQMVKLGHSAHTAVGGRLPPGPDEPPVEPGVWNVDPSPLAALLSLCALTMESEPNSSHVSYRFRTLGCGWDVPVPARCVDPGIEVDSEELRRWLSEQRKARSNADTPEGRQVRVSTPNDISESSIDGRNISTIDERDRVSPSSDIVTEGFGRYIRHRMELQNGPGSVRVVDFYKIWIERETPSKTIPDIENLDDRDDLWRAPAFGRNRRPLTKEYKYMFGAPFAMYSRYEALQQKDNQGEVRIQALRASSLSFAPDGSAVHGASQESLDQHRPSTRVSTLLSYMFSPDGTANQIQ
ncbi:hypothetical protein ASPCAL06893 [Aspergillus calidoustus]|uniref:Uncharacterized protein n=1 Tax=Aspergillus calidoustus TaxID=454130 RepID=A0A0U5G1E3_ASPCI|nr:hypothetical protein ASPCAL06893 [Aspergillus calidoustus]